MAQASSSSRAATTQASRLGNLRTRSSSRSLISRGTPHPSRQRVPPLSMRPLSMRPLAMRPVAMHPTWCTRRGAVHSTPPTHTSRHTARPHRPPTPPAHTARAGHEGGGHVAVCGSWGHIDHVGLEHGLGHLQHNDGPHGHPDGSVGGGELPLHRVPRRPCQGVECGGRDAARAGGHQPAPRLAQSAPLPVPHLSLCTSSGRARRLSAARCSQDSRGPSQ